MSSGETKKIRVEGGADVFGGASRAPKKAGTRKNKKNTAAEGTDIETVIKKEGSSLSPPTNVPIQAQQAQQAPKQLPIKSSVTPSLAPPQVVVKAPENRLDPHETHSKKNIKVILNKSKVLHRSVKLAPKKILNGDNMNKTRKSRKFVLGIPSLKRRITMAQKIRAKVTDTPIETLRKELVEKGLLKNGATTPPELIRQIAADAQILNKCGV